MAIALTARESLPQRTLLLSAVLAVAVMLAFANTLDVPFVFDDIASIHENPTLRPARFNEALSPPAGLTVSGRPLLNLSLALNFAFGGENVRGYHLVNIAIHAFAGVVLFLLLRRTFERPLLQVHFGRNATPLAFGAALLWALHPLQTESVTYIIQRAESLMGLLYLLTLYCFVRSVDSPNARLWQFACLGACTLGMMTKEVMVTAPLAVLLYDRALVPASSRPAWPARRAFYIALFATWLIVAALVWQTGDRSGTAGFSAGVSPWNYALTQCQAIVHYLQLVVWPYPLVFDYGPFVALPLPQIFPFALVVAGFLCALILVWRRAPVVALGGAIFFLILAPSSSLVPIETEAMAEHRLYLPLAALFTLATAGLLLLAPRRAVSVLLTLALGCACLTWQRNQVYRTPRILWTDTVRTAPKNPRAHYSIALVLASEGDIASAEKHYRAALALRPDYVAAGNSLGVLLADQARLPEAIAQFESVRRAHPSDLIALNGLGMAYFQQGRLPEAKLQFENAARADPNSAPVQNNLGCVLFELGQLPAARAHEETALRLKPDYAEAHYNLGNVLARQNLLPESRQSYERALHFAPDYAEAHINLAVVLQSMDERTAAIGHYREGLRLRPDNAVARRNLDELLRPSLRR